MRILIADDNAVFRSTLSQFLQRVDGWNIFEASNGQEAISQAAQHRPHVIILDLAMPVMDGLVAGRQLSVLMPETPLILCTMHNTPQVESEAQKYGIRKVLSKSESTQLIDIIRELIPPTDAPSPALPPLPPETAPETAM